MQVYYNAIVAIIVLFLNLRISVNMGTLDVELIILMVLQSLLIGLYAVLEIRRKRQEGRKNV